MTDDTASAQPISVRQALREAIDYARLSPNGERRQRWEAALAAPVAMESDEQLIRDGIEAFRLTREYVDPTGELLPAIEGWSWFDWCQKAAARLPEPVPPEERTCTCGAAREFMGGEHFRNCPLYPLFHPVEAVPEGEREGEET